MSQGTFIQLNAKGPQEELFYGDSACTVNPFKDTIAKTHTPFALEEKEIVFPDPFRMGIENRLVIPRDGDMLGNLILEFHLPVIPGAAPEDRWVDAIGYVLFRRIRFVIDDVELSNTERLWYDIADRLFLREPHKHGIDAMIGRGATLPLTQAHIIYVPLKLFCCKHHHAGQQFLPLLTAPGSVITLYIEAESFANCVTSYAGTLPPTTLDCRVIAEYVFLEGPEKERLINRPHLMLIETEQDAEEVTYREVMSDSGDTRIPLDTVKVDLSEINYPVKFLAWVCYPSNALSQRQYFTYTDDISGSTLFLDGVERFVPMHDGYFQYVQKYNHTLRAPAQDNVHVYSFALDASSWQPNGHCTFGEVGLPQLQVDLTTKRADRVVKVFILGYKFVVVERGRVTVKYT